MLFSSPIPKLPEEPPAKSKAKTQYDDKILMGILMMMAVLVALGLLFIDISSSLAKTPSPVPIHKELINQMGPLHTI